MARSVIMRVPRGRGGSDGFCVPNESVQRGRSEDMLQESPNWLSYVPLTSVGPWLPITSSRSPCPQLRIVERLRLSQDWFAIDCYLLVVVVPSSECLAGEDPAVDGDWGGNTGCRETRST